MAPRSNLTDHLVEALNVICGRLHRAGEPMPHPGVVARERTFYAEVVPPRRTWEQPPFNLTGHGLLGGEFPSAVLADRILSRDRSRLRALFVNGGNSAMCLPDQRKAAAGLKALELLVTIDPFLSATAQLAHYVIPPKMMYEREDVLFGPRLEAAQCDVPYAMYLPPVSSEPDGADLIDDWAFYREIADRLELDLRFAGVALERGTPMTTADMLAILLRDARVPLEEIRRHPNDRIFDGNLPLIAPARAEATARFAIMPTDVAAELRDYLEQRPSGGEAFRLIVRRERHMMNSLQSYAPRARTPPYNPLYICPADLAALGLAAGSRVRIENHVGAIEAFVTADETLPSGIVAMTHCRGVLPKDDAPYETVGASTGRLVSTTEAVEAITPCPR